MLIFNLCCFRGEFSTKINKVLFNLKIRQDVQGSSSPDVTGTRNDPGFLITWRPKYKELPLVPHNLTSHVQGIDVPGTMNDPWFLVTWRPNYKELPWVNHHLTSHVQNMTLGSASLDVPGTRHDPGFLLPWRHMFLGFSNIIIRSSFLALNKLNLYITNWDFKLHWRHMQIWCAFVLI